MQKKLLAVFIIILIFFPFGIKLYAGAETGASNINLEDISGIEKAYFNSPSSVAAAQVDGKGIVFIGDKSPSKLFACYENKVYEILHTITNPYKLEIFSNYIFVFDRTKLLIFDFSVPSSIKYLKDFTVENKIIEDFSITGDTMFILFRDYTVQKFTISLQGNIEAGAFYDYSSVYPDNITASDSENFILKKDDTYINADLSGNTSVLKSGVNGNYTRFYGGKLYYCVSDKIECFSISDGKTVSLSVNSAAYPLSESVSSVSGLYACESGLYITDSLQKKTIRLNLDTLVYDGFCLSSFSYDLGRYNSPQNISVSMNDIIICDTLNDRVQIIDESGTSSVNIEKPSFAVKAGGILYAVSNNRFFTGDDLQAEIVLPDGLQNIRDLKCSSDGRLYLLGSSALYVYSGGAFTQALAINSGLRFSVNIKTQDLYLLTENAVLLYDKNYSLKNTIPLETGIYKSVETDFGGSIYITAENYAEGKYTAILKYNAADFSLTEYITNKSDICGLAVNHNTGDVYTASSFAHAVYKILKNEMNVAIAVDIPEIRLPENPLDAAYGVYFPQVITIEGYPSTIFYPFSDTLKNEEFYPAEMAHEGGITYIDSGVNVLSVYSSKGYNLILYGGKFGFVLSDNITVLKNKEAPYQAARLVLAANVYSLPYRYTGGNGVFVKDTLERNSAVKLLGEFASYDESVQNWYLIEYQSGSGQSYGYINKTLAAAETETAKRPFAAGNVYNKDGKTDIYCNIELKNVIYTLDSGADIKIFSYSGDYAYIEYTIDENNSVKGYILKTDIAVDDSLEKQKLGFILSFAAIAAGILFVIIKRKFLY